MTNLMEGLWYEPPDDAKSSASTGLRSVYDALGRTRTHYALHGVAILYDCHSIRSEIPFLFEGILPDFNIGTNIGITCDPEIETGVFEICHGAEGYTSILNGRLRVVGAPAAMAIRLELARNTDGIGPEHASKNGKTTFFL